MKKRLAAWLLTLSMLLTVFSPLSAMAFSNSGEYTLPVDSYITYGIHGYKGHTGVDFKASIGTTVVASKAGTVVTAIDQGCQGSHRPGNSYGCALGNSCSAYKAKPGSYGSYANYIVVDHGNGVKTYYCHLKTGSFRVSVGDYVEQGTILAESGVAGNTTGPHLHFEVRDGGTIVDPEDYLTNTYVESSSNRNRLPEGSLDNCEGKAGYIYVRGWSFDWDSLGTYVTIHVYIDGEGHEITANTPRPDVLTQYPDVGPNHGFDATFIASAGTHTVAVYAIDNENPSLHTVLGQETVTVSAGDTTGPTISDAKVTNVDSTGYTVTCTVTDASGVNRVQFPTWTTKNDQDDLLSDWEVNPKASGTRNGNTFTFRVKTSDHNNESGEYHTDIYAYDNSYFGNRSGPTKLTVTVPVPTVAVSGVSLNKSSLSFTGIGSAQTLTATISPSNATHKTISWSSSNEKVAVVENGKVTSKGIGTAIITAKSNNGLTAKCTVTVVDKTPPMVGDGYRTIDVDSFGYTVICAVADDDCISEVRFVTWTTAEGEKNAKTVVVKNPSSMSVKSRVLKADHGGATSGYTTRIEAYDPSGNVTTRTLTDISIPIGVDKVTLSTTDMTLAGIGVSQKITATITPDNAVNHTIIWSSSNESVATVSGGNVTAKGYGTATITATASNGVTATCKVTVVPVTLSSITVAIKPSKTNYYVGNTLDTTGLTLKAVYNDGSEKTISNGFTCTPTKLENAGTQTITVSYAGKSATFTVNVQKINVSSISIASKPNKLDYYEGDTLDTTGLTLKVAYNDGSEKTISSDFTCTPMNLEKIGTQTVTVNYAGKTTSFDVKVSEKPIPEGTRFVLTYDANGGGMDVVDKEVFYGMAYGILDVPECEGYIFEGWYTDPVEGERITRNMICTLKEDTTVYAHWIPTSGIGWNLERNVLTIDCTGAMENYSSAAETPWFKVRSQIEEVVVTEGVTALSDYAFYGCENLTKVTLPKSLKKIGELTFYGCTSLKTLEIPAGVEEVGDYAFASSGLENLVFWGNAPMFGIEVFAEVDDLGAWYIAGTEGWNKSTLQLYGGRGNWTCANREDMESDLSALYES